MRFRFALLAAAAIAFAPAALAQPNITPVSFSPEFQTELVEELGTREGEFLSAAVTQAIRDELTRRGAGAGAPVTIEVSIVDADPNRPTMQQLMDTPGLDFRSVSIGGAELQAVLRGADGQVLTEVSHRRYNHSLQDIGGAATTWTEARRAIRRFADKVADAYIAHASAR